MADSSRGSDVSLKRSSSDSSSAPRNLSNRGLRRQESEQARRVRSTSQALDKNADEPQTISAGVRIEHYWDCKLADSLPTEVRQGLRLANGKRVGREQIPSKTLPAEQWASTEVLGQGEPAGKQCIDVISDITRARVKEGGERLLVRSRTA